MRRRLRRRIRSRELDEHDHRNEGLHQDLGRTPLHRNPKVIGTIVVIVGLVWA
jgi:hypothetical protein